MFIYRFIRNLFQNLKYQKILRQAYEQDQLIVKISTLLGVQFKMDWIGRLYAVINPNIKDGKYDPDQIYEFDTNGDLSNTEWVTKWIMTRMNILRNFIQSENLFDLLEYKIKDLGNLNYLVTFQPITLTPLMSSIVPALVELGVICTVVIGYLAFV